MSDTIYQGKRVKELLKPILETQFIGLSRVLLGMPIEHIFDRFKTQLQSELKNTNLKQVYKQIISKNGIVKGIFAGFSSNISIQVLKQYYRWPMMILLPKYIKENMPANVVERFPGLHKGLTGFSIAVMESVITCPIERLKCQLMTKDTKSSVLVTLLRNNTFGSIIKNLYTGMQVMLMKQTVSWINYLYWDHKVRYLFKETPQHCLSYSQIVMCSILTAVPNILFVQPFDTLKTLYQMQQNEPYRKLTIRQAFRKVYQTNGLIGIYSGWKLRASQFVFQALLTTPVIDYLERNHGLN